MSTKFEILAVGIDCGTITLECLPDAADMQRLFDTANELGVTVEQLIAGIAPCACTDQPPPRPSRPSRATGTT